VGLKAVNCLSGEPLAQEQKAASSKEKVLNTMGEAAAKLRGELGESLATVQNYDVPLSDATTSSLEALQAYSLGEKASQQIGPEAGLPYHHRAIQLDPNFAMAYFATAIDYQPLGEMGRASEYFRKAFELREHASEREKLSITAAYYNHVTGELDKAAEAYQLMIDNYPRRAGGFSGGYDGLGGVYAEQGKYEKAAEEARQSHQIAPDNLSPYVDGANYQLALQHFDQVRPLVQEAATRKLNNLIGHEALFGLAFAGSDPSALAVQQQWFASIPALENFGLSLDSDTQAYSGHLGKARELTQRSVDSAIKADSKEGAAIWWENSALREAAFGNIAEARQAATKGLKLDPNSQGVEAETALAYAMAGDVARAQPLAQDLNQRYPLDTQMQSLWLPGIQGQLALNRKKPADSIDQLQRALPPIEYGQIPFINQISCLYPTYIRGQAYLAEGQGKEAAAEFQKILDHSGIVWNCWTGALARLGVARANALQAKNSTGADADAARVRALAAYKDFLTLWKDADPDIPIYKQAKAEFAKLQ
jgi:eukaryotic-like serine/threonine-protein kinase